MPIRTFRGDALLLTFKHTQIYRGDALPNDIVSCTQNLPDDKLALLLSAGTHPDRPLQIPAK